MGEIWRGGANNQRYVGNMAVDITKSGYLGTNYPPDAWGAEAYSKMKPTKPDFSALVSIYELREVVPMLKQRFLKDGLHSIGNYYLALKFGWEPLLRDCVNLVTTQINAQKRIAQLLRDNGKPVRRRIMLQNLVSDPVESSGSSYSALQPVLVTQFYRSQPKYRGRDYTRDVVWGSARYKYWLPDGPKDINWTIAMRARLLGLKPTPADVWNAMPWTWLMDWFANVGDVLDNLDAGVANRLAADYFYMMRTRELRRDLTAWGNFVRKDGQLVDVSGTSFHSSFQKWRVKGDPFGLNTNQNQLTGMQLAIMGALGLSRLR